MGCACKNKEYHPCQHGGKCKCGGKCKKESYSNLVGSLDEFKDEDKNVGRAILYGVGGVTLAVLAFYLFRKI